MKAKSVPNIEPSCSNCYYADNPDSMFGGKCGLSGFFTSTERSVPTKCGKRYKNWLPNYNVLSKEDGEQILRDIKLTHSRFLRMVNLIGKMIVSVN